MSYQREWARLHRSQNRAISETNMAKAMRDMVATASRGLDFDRALPMGLPIRPIFDKRRVLMKQWAEFVVAGANPT
jgi:hypothetical protein